MAQAPGISQTAVSRIWRAFGLLIIDRLLKAVRHAADEHSTGVLMVEQHVRKALKYADRVYVMRSGRIEIAATAAEAGRRLEEIEAAYLSHSAPALEPHAP